jgi:hypothetical protein
VLLEFGASSRVDDGGPWGADRDERMGMWLVG